MTRRHRYLIAAPSTLLFALLAGPLTATGPPAGASTPSKPAEIDVAATLDRIGKSLDMAVTGWEILGEHGAWKEYRPGDGVRSAEFSLRVRAEGRKVFAGTPVEGTPLRARLVISARGLVEAKVSVDGRPAESFSIDGSAGTALEATREILVAERAEPRVYEILVEARNKGFQPPRTESWPPRRTPLPEEGIRFSVRAEVVYPAAEETLREVRDWRLAFRTAHRLLHPDLVRRTFIGKEWPIEDARKTPPERLDALDADLARAVAAFDVGALEKGETRRLRASIAESLRLAGGIPDFVGGFTLEILGNAHIDVAWLWRMAETRRVARNTYATVLENMAEYPELRYAQSQAVTYRWIEQDDPALFERIREAVRSGRWEIVGGMWVEPDCNLISGESWVRQILYGKRYFREKFGAEVRAGWNPDSFGYNWNMPQIYLKSGIRYFITQKIGWNDTTVFPHYLFWWAGADGSRILSYFPPRPYDDRLEIEPLATSMGHYEATTGSRDALILFGLGDHGGGPNREILDRARGYARAPFHPAFRPGNALAFLERMEREMGPALPEWSDELYLEYHRGTYTTQAAVKKNNRRAECGLGAAEKIATVASLLGRPYPAARLEETWKETLTNQFHDILPGSSIAPVYRDAAEAYQRIDRAIGRVAAESGSALAAAVDTRSLEGAPFVVFNPLSWERTDVARVPLPERLGAGAAVLDARGARIPSEILRSEDGGAEILFVAEKVPPVGYRAYAIVPDEVGGAAAAGKADGGPSAKDDTLENEFVRVVVNPATGNISSLRDRRSGREFVPPGREANVLEIHEDRPERWDAWNIGYTGRRWEIDRADSAGIVSAGPVRAVYRVTKSFLGLTKEREAPAEDFPSSFFTQEIVVWRGLDRVDVRMEADWWEDHLMLKVAFPLDVTADMASFEIPFAAISRSTRSETPAERARFETPALKWADLSDDAGGLSLLNDSKHGHDVHDGVMKLTLLRSPTWPDPIADRGRHTFTYSLYPHAGRWSDAETVRRGWELNVPLQAFVTDRHEGTLPAEESFFSATGGVVLDAVKRAEDGRGWIVRLYESLGRPEETVVRFHRPPASAAETDLMEESGRPVRIGSDGAVRLAFGRFEIKTLRVEF